MTLAYHYSKTGNVYKAVQYLSRFAEKVAGMDAHTEALAALEEARAHAARLPAEEQDRRLIDLVIREAHSLHFLGRRQETVALLLQHRDRLERLHDPSLAGQYYFWLGFAHAWLGHRKEAARALGHSLEEATQSGDEALMGRVHRALAIECVYSGRSLEEAVAHGRQAVSLLERTEDRFWLSQALFALSYSCYYSGNFDGALEAAGRLDALGEATGSRRARANAATMTGLSQATRGDWEVGIKACDPHAGAGRSTGGPGSLPAIRGVVSDDARCSLCPGGQLDKAREVAGHALDISVDVTYLLGIGWSHQFLGLAARTQGALVEAGRHLGDALQAFVSVQSRFEMGRTLFFLASIAYAQGRNESAGMHLKEAHSLFTALRVPKYVERTEHLACEFGFPSFTQMTRL
jgi:tetratricopeptide (TPR) repeat protein